MSTTNEPSEEKKDEGLLTSLIQGATNYPNTLSEDNWENEIEDTPLLMTKPFDNTKELSPELSAIQAMIYEDNNPNESAKAYKEEGNDFYRNKNYKNAITSYSEALKLNISQIDLKAQILNNRSACQASIGNNRSALEDAESSIQLQPEYIKAYIRSAQICFKLELYDTAVEYCDRGLNIQMSDEKLLEIRNMSLKESKLKQRMERIKEKRVTDLTQQNQLLIDIILSRNFQLGVNLAQLSIKNLEMQQDFKVHMNEDGSLNWPVVFLYPEHKQSDIIVAFNENITFSAQLAEILHEAPPWDDTNLFTANNVKVAILCDKTNSYVKINKSYTLLQAMQHPAFILTNLTLNFYIMRKRNG